MREPSGLCCPVVGVSSPTLGPTNAPGHLSHAPEGALGPLWTCPTITQLSYHLRGLSDATWLADKDKEKIQTSMRAVHILRVSWEQGGVVPVTASWPAPQAVNVSFLPT